MRTRTLLAWISAGLIGLALTAGATYAATQLSSQHVGLSAEPPSAGELLAPPHPAHPVPSVTAPASPPPSLRNHDDDSGRDPDHDRDGGTGLRDWDD